MLWFILLINFNILVQDVKADNMDPLANLGILLLLKFLSEIWFLFWVKQFAEGSTKQRSSLSTLDCKCFSAVASKNSLFFPAHLISCRLWQNNSQEKLRHWACTLLDSILNPLFTPGWHFFTQHVADLTPLQPVLWNHSI